MFSEGTEVTDTHTLSGRALRYVITRITDDSSFFSLSPSLSLFTYFSLLYTVTIAVISRLGDKPLDSYCTIGGNFLMNETIELLFQSP